MDRIVVRSKAPGQPMTAGAAVLVAVTVWCTSNDGSQVLDLYATTRAGWGEWRLVAQGRTCTLAGGGGGGNGAVPAGHVGGDDGEPYTFHFEIELPASGDDVPGDLKICGVRGIYR